ncbi:MAG TPA: biotin--[acetyl-CoA-carboxylase] ligase [Bacillota bacterium]|jgi:BirA family biotin operon repressor/biotin-[acetyl-CoA-carboxylase] ligase|nr:biotin--[acetyl-CoA-carboxylase] ligase [Bacillota bacterium]HPZ21983.1 biotin--[acetyl-CoA-carboxylase] ligase [Bacillota bacterium]HQD19801.1 biotin--[acetyl-CoA-carboxylase] ligase [Bacillota bacterium]
MDSDYFFVGQENLEETKKILSRELNLHWFPRLASTNLLAQAEPWPQGTVIAADCQDRGRGRLGREWQSPPGFNLYFSLVYYPSLPRHNWGGFSLAAGVAIAWVLKPFVPGLGLKWPNDLLVSGEKLGGILLEATGSKLVTGVGINVNQQSFPPELNATSLKLCTARNWRRDRLLASLVREILDSLNMWNRGRFEQVIEKWRQLDIVLGKAVAARRGGQVIKGRALDVGAGGELLVEDELGVLHALHSGEVTLKA